MMSRMAIADALAWMVVPTAAVASGAGLLLPDLYRDAPYWVQQARGTDLATLFLAVPVLGLGLRAAGRGSPLGRVASLGALLYLVYNYAIIAFSVAMNPLAALYIAILGLTVWSVGLVLTATDLGSLAGPVVERLPRRLTAAVLMTVALLFGLLWLGQIAEATLSGGLPADVERAGLPTNPVYALDLALFLPLAAVAGIGLVRRRAAAAAFAVPALI